MLKQSAKLFTILICCTQLSAMENLTTEELSLIKYTSAVTFEDLLPCMCKGESRSHIQRFHQHELAWNDYALFGPFKNDHLYEQYFQDEKLLKTFVTVYKGDFGVLTNTIDPEHIEAKKRFIEQLNILAKLSKTSFVPVHETYFLTSRMFTSDETPEFILEPTYHAPLHFFAESELEDMLRNNETFFFYFFECVMQSEHIMLSRLLSKVFSEQCYKALLHPKSSKIPRNILKELEKQIKTYATDISDIPNIIYQFSLCFWKLDTACRIIEENYHLMKQPDGFTENNFLQHNKKYILSLINTCLSDTTQAFNNNTTAMQSIDHRPRQAYVILEMIQEKLKTLQRYVTLLPQAHHKIA